MMIEKDAGCVATWWFESTLPLACRSPESLHELLVMCQTAVEIFVAHELLRPLMVVMSGWTKPGSAGPHLVSDEPPQMVALNPSGGGRQFIDACEHALTELQSTRGFLYPIYVDITGTGVVFDANGKPCEQPNVCWIRGTTLGHQLVYVKTQTDAWLPYTLRAEPQSDAWKRNAPRLEASLREIHEALGVAPAYEPETPYARVHEYSLSNYAYDDGEVIEVI